MFWPRYTSCWKIWLACRRHLFLSLLTSQSQIRLIHLPVRFVYRHYEETMRRFTVLVVLAVATSYSLFAQNSSADFDKLVDETFDSVYKSNPSNATADGFHQYDTKIEDLSKAGVAA